MLIEVLGATAATAAVAVLLVLLAGLWAVGMVSALALVYRYYAWRRMLASRGELPMRWVVRDIAGLRQELAPFFAAVSRPSHYGTPEEQAVRRHFWRFARSFAAFLVIAAAATLVRLL